MKNTFGSHTHKGRRRGIMLRKYRNTTQTVDWEGALQKLKVGGGGVRI